MWVFRSNKIIPSLCSCVFLSDVIALKSSDPGRYQDLLFEIRQIDINIEEVLSEFSLDTRNLPSIWELKIPRYAPANALK